MIKPAVGLVVHFHRSYPSPETRGPGYQPLAAIVTYVHSDRMVNLAVFDMFGVTEPKLSVHLRQDDEVQPPSGPYAEWMPGQEKVAAGEIEPTAHAVVKADAPKLDDAIGRWLPGERETAPTLHEVTKAAVSATASLVALDEHDRARTVDAPGVVK